MADLSRHEQNFEHAVWRVKFLSSLLETHRSLARRGRLWRQQEAELVDRLVWAEKELERLQDPHSMATKQVAMMPVQGSC